MFEWFEKWLVKKTSRIFNRMQIFFFFLLVVVEKVAATVVLFIPFFANQGNVHLHKNKKYPQACMHMITRIIRQWPDPHRQRKEGGKIPCLFYA